MRTSKRQKTVDFVYATGFMYKTEREGRLMILHSGWSRRNTLSFVSNYDRAHSDSSNFVHCSADHVNVDSFCVILGHRAL
ncbi:hypothetical protein QR680_000089 [Steinernema hermaphroditum]|uniref:Uncharacterized protein n=1 Tax=Steinernema hermaphroditum TaxID=289476 RepID=A0AA39LCY6_9BILA|nr:hypothetical protein QR680_000089 [Steinernema hermaphroditum]